MVSAASPTAASSTTLPGSAPRGRRWPLSVAPMVDCTDRHYRFFMRQITRRTLLYSEMLATRAVLGEKRAQLLGYHATEPPLAIQLGGDDAAELAECARIAEDHGYSEINLNVGCPSPRVTRGRFGACLMAEPALVARCVQAMRRAVSLPVTVKHRIGIDDLESYELLARFVRVVAEAGCDRFTVHARIALLNGPSPKKNRTVPPLRYDDVYRLKQEHPQLAIEINGGVTTLAQAAKHLSRVDGVMIGRAAYETPFIFARADTRFFGDTGPAPSRRQVIEALVDYIDSWCAAGGRAHQVTRHVLGLFAGQPGARGFRRLLSEQANRPEARGDVLREATADIADDVLDA